VTRVGDLPIVPLPAVEPDASLAQVARLVRVEDCDCVAVVEAGRMFGIVTERYLTSDASDPIGLVSTRKLVAALERSSQAP
jgi:CBS domain-containing protein